MTVGHSTHAFEAFISLLERYEIQVLADVRTVPKSKRSPHFQQAVLARALSDRAVRYVHLPELGGWRRATSSSPNGAWRNASFQGYADYAMTESFAAGLAELCHLATNYRTAIMCAEALWWRCHRRLVADRLVVSGWDVMHIGSDGRASSHSLPPFAVVGSDGCVTYPVAFPAPYRLTI